MLRVNIEPKRARHCSSIHCARRDQISVCSGRPIRGPGGSPVIAGRAAGRSSIVAVARLTAPRPPPYTGQPARCVVRRSVPDRVAWRRRGRSPPPPRFGRVPVLNSPLRPAAARPAAPLRPAAGNRRAGARLRRPRRPQAGRPGRRELADRRPAAQAGAGLRAQRRLPPRRRPPIPMAELRRVRDPRRRRPAEGAPLRPPRRPAPAAADARPLPRRRLDGRRPRDPRQRLPLPRRPLRGRRSSPPPTGWPPSTPSRPRSKTRGPPGSGPSPSPRSWAPTRPGSRSAATRPAATWPPASASRCATRAARGRRCSC